MALLDILQMAGRKGFDPSRLGQVLAARGQQQVLREQAGLDIFNKELAQQVQAKRGLRQIAAGESLAEDLPLLLALQQQREQIISPAGLTQETLASARQFAEGLAPSRDVLRSQAIEDVEQQLRGQEEALQRGLRRRGISPTSLSSLAQQRQLALAKASARVGALTGAERLAQEGRRQALGTGLQLGSQLVRSTIAPRLQEIQEQLKPIQARSERAFGILGGRAGLVLQPRVRQIVGGATTGSGASFLRDAGPGGFSLRNVGGMTRGTAGQQESRQRQFIKGATRGF